MSEKIIAIEKAGGPFQATFQRLMKLVPEKDKNDKKLQRLIAFRLKLDGELPTGEYLNRKIREAMQCGYSGSLYDFLKDDPGEKQCGGLVDNSPDPPEVA